MRSLNAADYRKALDFIAAIGEARDLDSYAARLVPELHRVIDCAAVGYNEVNMRRRRVRWVSDVQTTPADVEAFEAHIHDNPLVNYAAKNPASGATAVSDLMSQRQWHATGVYRDFYRPLRIEDMMAVAPFAGELVIGISLFRERGVFSTRDHDMLSLLEPHLANAYRNAARVGDLHASVALLERGYDVSDLGAIVIDAQDRIANMTARARALLAIYFGAKEGQLPESLRGWLKRGAPKTGAPMPEVAPLAVARGAARLTLRCVRHDGHVLILLREGRQEPEPDQLRALGLSRRESQMLALAARGKSDRQIADALSLSIRTVNHTLANVYRKLGVPNRAAAVARAAGEG